MGYPPSTPSWEQLGQMRRRGQRPVGGVWLSDDADRRWLFWRKGLYALPLDGPEVMLAGLDVVMIVRRSLHHQKRVEAVFQSGPRKLSIDWEGEKWQCAI